MGEGGVSTDERDPEVAAMVRNLAAAFPVPRWTAERAGLFYRVLVDLGVSAARRAVTAWLAEEEKPPTPAGLKRKAREHDPNPFAGTEFENYPHVWECRDCGGVHKGAYSRRPVCPSGGART